MAQISVTLKNKQGICMSIMKGKALLRKVDTVELFFLRLVGSFLR